MRSELYQNDFKKKNWNLSFETNNMRERTIWEANYIRETLVTETITVKTDKNTALSLPPQTKKKRNKNNKFLLHTKQS